MGFVIYIHTFPNGKKYVGISKDIKRRFRNGKGYHNQPIVRNAIEKYGWKNIRTEIIFENLTETEAKRIEIVLIALLRTAEREFGYNQTLGGEGAYGRKVSDANKIATGKRMSQIHKGTHLSEEHKAKISAALKGKPKNYSEAGRQRIIESNMTRGVSEETRKKMSENTKRAMAEKNMSAYLSEKWQSEKETRKAKLRVTMYSRYGTIPQKYDLRKDIITLGKDPNDFPELFGLGKKEMEK